MNLKDLITRFRVLANDKVEPYFWADDEITTWLNDAVDEACLRGRLLHTVETEAFQVESGKAVYPYHADLSAETGDVFVYEIDRIVFKHADGEQCLILVSPEDAYGAEDGAVNVCTDGLPLYAVQSDERITLYPKPEKDGAVWVGGYFLPRQMAFETDSPTINSLHHKHLVQWALAEAFSIPDAEMFDINRSELARQKFDRYFGLQTDSDVRRITREDVLHVNDKFWI